REWGIGEFPTPYSLTPYSLFWALQFGDGAEQVAIGDQDAVAVEADGPGVLQLDQHAADRLGRRVEVPGDRSACDTRPAERRVLGLRQQEARQPRQHGVEREVF